MKRAAMHCEHAMSGTPDDAQLIFIKVCRHQRHTLDATIPRR
jgi:hypothetical protein